MRIVIDATAAVSGGKVYLTQLLSHAAQLDLAHEFIIFHTDDFAEVPAAAGRRFQFRRIGLPALTSGHWRGASLLRMLWRLIVLPWHLHRLRPDLLFSNAGFAPGWRPAQTKLIVALHNSMPLHDELVRTEGSRAERLRLVWLRRLLRKTLRHCDGVIVFSQDLKQRVMAQADDLDGEPAVIYHGIEWGEAERQLKPDPAQLGRLGIRRPYLLCVSQCQRYKNLLRLLDAFASLLAEHPDLSLVLVGPLTDPTYWKEVEQAIARLGGGSRVTLIPGLARDELKAIYRAALAFVYPSLAENCPFAVLEALAFGLPIAASRISSLPEIGGEAAVYFDPYDPAEIAAVLNQLINRESLREELSRKAVARAKLFSWPESVRQTLRVFERVTEMNVEGSEESYRLSHPPTPE